MDVPQNHKRALCDLTVADRLALYDHVTGFLSNQDGETPTTSNEDLYVDLVKKMQRGKTDGGSADANCYCYMTKKTSVALFYVNF